MIFGKYYHKNAGWYYAKFIFQPEQRIKACEMDAIKNCKEMPWEKEWAQNKTKDTFEFDLRDWGKM